MEKITFSNLVKRREIIGEDVTLFRKVEDAHSIKSGIYLADDEESENLYENGEFVYLMDMACFNDILWNLSQQKQNYSLELAFDAFDFYLENDAFIDLEK